MTKHFLDKQIRTFMSKKLLVWIVATVGLYTLYLSDEQWTAITLGYVGSQAFVDAVATFRHGQQRE